MKNVNIITDRGSNFIKAFVPYEPIYCFGHRINNVLKICFFQQQNKKKKQIQLVANNISIAPKPTSTTPDLTVQNESLSSSSESEQELEEEQQKELNKRLPIVKPKYKRAATSAENAQKLLLEDVPPEAKQILLVLRQAKKLVKYVKSVSIQDIYPDIFLLTIYLNVSLLFLGRNEPRNQARRWCHSSSEYRCQMVVDV